MQPCQATTHQDINSSTGGMTQQYIVIKTIQKRHVEIRMTTNARKQTTVSLHTLDHFQTVIYEPNLLAYQAPQFLCPTIICSKIAKS